MVQRIRLEFLDEGFAALRTSQAVTDEVMERAARVAAAAGEGFEASVFPMGFGGSPRTGAVVRAETREARLAEAEDKVLSIAIDRGR